jgi:hypothetical protein
MGDALTGDAFADAQVLDVDLSDAPFADAELLDAESPDAEAPPDAGRDAGANDLGLPVITDAGAVFEYAPSNFDPALFAPPYVDLVVATSCDIDANDPPAFGVTCGLLAPIQSAIITLSDGTAALLIPVGNLTVALGGTIDIDGELPVIFAVYGDADIDGTIDADASNRRGGPGSMDSCTLGQGGDGIAPGNRAGGGGGGAFGLSGANGGDGDSPSPTSGSGGQPEPNTSSLVPLRGGCGGGDGGGGRMTGGEGGGGGGAVQISASRNLFLRGRIHAGGGGGEGGRNQQGDRGGGGGGGSGGAVLLEAAALEIQASAVIGATGGGGGEGADNNDGEGGDDGNEMNRDVARGGQTPQHSGGQGGTGGGFMSGADLGESSSEGGGGGGGGVGRIRLRSNASCTPRMGSKLIGVVQIDCP